MPARPLTPRAEVQHLVRGLIQRNLGSAGPVSDATIERLRRLLFAQPDLVLAELSAGLAAAGPARVQIPRVLSYPAPDGSLDVLVRAMRPDYAWQEVDAAFAALRSWDARARGHLPALKRCLGAPVPWRTRLVVTRGLAACAPWAPEAEAWLRRLVEQPAREAGPRLRRAAIGALDRWPAWAPRTIAVLVEHATRDRDREVRRVARVALARHAKVPAVRAALGTAKRLAETPELRNVARRLLRATNRAAAR